MDCALFVLKKNCAFVRIPASVKTKCVGGVQMGSVKETFNKRGKLVQ